jgi:hypothetical protein
MAAQSHIACNVNDIWRRSYKLGKQLQVALLSEIHLKLRERSFIKKIISFVGTDRFPGRKGKVFPITMYTYAIRAIHTLDNGQAYS